MKVNRAIYEPLVESTKKTTVHQGGTSCFSADTLVVTDKGLKSISALKPGDVVKCLNESTNSIEYKPVKKVMQFDNTKKTVRVKLKNGSTITATDDHKFYYKGGWYSLKHILSLVEPTIKDI